MPGQMPKRCEVAEMIFGRWNTSSLMAHLDSESGFLFFAHIAVQGLEQRGGRAAGLHCADGEGLPRLGATPEDRGLQTGIGFGGGLGGRVWGGHGGNIGWEWRGWLVGRLLEAR